MAEIVPSQSILKVGLGCRCPRCGEGRLCDGFIRLRPSCEACGLDYGFADPADGPAFFVMMTMAFPVTAFGIWFELAYEPAFWVHLVVTLPLILLACIPIIRPLKGVFIASQYIHRAEEGRFDIQQRPPAAQTTTVIDRAARVSPV